MIDCEYNEMSTGSRHHRLKLWNGIWQFLLVKQKRKIDITFLKFRSRYTTKTDSSRFQTPKSNRVSSVFQFHFEKQKHFKFFYYCFIKKNFFINQFWDYLVKNTSIVTTEGLEMNAVLILANWCVFWKK